MKITPEIQLFQKEYSYSSIEMKNTGFENNIKAEIQYYYRNFYLNGKMKLKEISQMLGITRFKIMQYVDTKSFMPYECNSLYNQRISEVLSRTNTKTLKHLNSLSENIN